LRNARLGNGYPLERKNGGLSVASDLQLHCAPWREIVSPVAYRVLPEEATERPGSSPLKAEKRAGKRYCNNGVALAFVPEGQALPALRS
jgi:peptide methionine sulfoxide reductase MsrB